MTHLQCLKKLLYGKTGLKNLLVFLFFCQEVGRLGVHD